MFPYAQAVDFPGGLGGSVGLFERGTPEPKSYKGWLQPPSCECFSNPSGAQIEDFSL